MLELWVKKVGKPSMVYTHCEYKGALERRANKNEYSGAEHNGRGNLFRQGQRRLPQHGERNHDEADVGTDVGRKS